MSRDRRNKDTPLGPRFLERAAHAAKKVFKPSGRVPTSYTPPPQMRPADPPPQPMLSDGPAPALLSQLPALSQQPAASSASQPAPSTSHFANDGNQSANAQSRLGLAAKKVGSDAWARFRTTLQLLEKSLDIFPTLKSAVAEFLGVVDTFEIAAQNQNDYAELASNLQNVVREFGERPGDHTSSKLSDALRAMASGLEKEMRHIQEQQQRSGLSRHIGAGQDLVDLRGCYRRVETLCRELQASLFQRGTTDRRLTSPKNKAIIDMWRNLEEQKTDARLKELNAALKAMYNSSLADVVGRRACTPRTRQAILAEMQQWADDPESPKVYWLNGMAGTGKTTLAYSFCAEMQLAGRLGASFFCSRADADSREVSRIVPTIAHQLARLLPSYCEALIRQISEDKEIGARRAEMQFEKLIRDPLREVEASVPEGIIVMIDALDECDRRDGVRDILNALLLNAKDLPVKFFVTCRPEPGLFDTLQSTEVHYRCVLHLHDIEASFVQADIKIYLEAELAGTSLPAEKLGTLAEQAGALFIYAATAVRYIYPPNRQVNVHQRLENLLSITSKTTTNKHKGIDELYTAVLTAPFTDEDLDPQEQENIRLVLDTAVCAREPTSITTIAKLLELDDEQDVIHALQHLRSVLHLSQGTNLISTLHASFPDFMLDRKRSKALCCNAVEHNRLIALRCFSLMKRLLKFNICQLESSFILDEDIPDLTERIEKAIPDELYYACCYWGAHLVFVETLNEAYPALEEFLSNRLLFWIEVLNLQNCLSAGTEAMAHVHAWLQKSGGPHDVIELALDAGRFVTAFGLSPASHSTPHIYISALPFWPETRPIRLQYWKHMQGSMRLEGTGMDRDTSCLAMWDAGDAITCLASSLDGTRLVSGSANGFIYVWDAYNGDLVVEAFEEHTNWVMSVAFSSDGARVVTGSEDQTICVWDAYNGDLVAGPFKGHTGSVNSVTFSPDGTRIVSGSDDETVCVWDAYSGLLIAGPFEWNIGSVWSVAFSPDGTRIVSGSNDETVCVWDAHSGLLVAGPFEGHTGSVWSVGFSPDGARIVSGSYDQTIRVWGVHSGLLVAGPFEGHTNAVCSVVFSPGGTRIISGSYDKTIRVWDAHSGLLVAGPFQGHTDVVCSVTLSPDSTRIISGSHDHTIRVWDAHSGLLVTGSFMGHTDSVWSVAFSPDSTRIVSGSDDETIRVWDAFSGLLVAGPFEGHADRVSSVAFSPDSTRIVSGSYDSTIRVWDAHSGFLVAGPFEGHTDAVNSTAFSPDGACITSGSADGTICVWDAHSGLLVARPFEGHTDSIWSVSFSPSGTRIVSGSDDETVIVWDVHSGLPVAGPFEGHTGSVWSVGFSPDGARIVSGSCDQTIRVWDAHTGLLIAGPFEGHTSAVCSVAFSPDGTRIVSGSYDKTIRFWDADSGLLDDGLFIGCTESVNSVALSPDGTRMVSSSNERTIRFWAITPPNDHDSRHLKNWRMDEMGMITTQQGQLLLCVPVDLRVRIARPQNTVCIYDKGVLKLDFDDVLLGNEWVKCYQSL